MAKKDNLYDKIENSLKEEKETTKKEVKDKTNHKKEVEEKSPKNSKVKINENKKNVTLNEVVSKINDEKGQIKNPPIEKKESLISSIIVIILIIAIIWGITYYLFLGPKAVFKKSEVKENVEEKVPVIDKVNESVKNASETSARGLIDAAYLWYTEALLKYGSLVDVQVSADGTITKLNSNDSLTIENEKLNVKSLPTSLESMVISKDGIIVASKINYNDYCFTYNGETLTEIDC